MVTVIEQSAFINAVGENIDDVIAVADNEANIDTVAGVSSSVTTVATNIANVNAVGSDLLEPVSEINTVAVDIANVNSVGTNIANVNTVAGISANVTTVAGISSNVTTVAGISSAVTGVNAISSAVTGVDANATDISAVNANKTNIDTVAGIAANVTTVAGISANVTSVAGNSTNINTVATDISNVNSVGGNIANVNAVAGNATNINAVNANATNINTVAGINANVTTVAGISANVTTVAGISGNVTSVAGNASNINQVASDTVAINSASANATTATTKAAEALASANAASASAAAASAVALGDEPVRHSVRPSLLLDFANTKTLDPRITFTRASTGTYYDGKTVAKAEENLLIYSQEFDNAYWTKAGITVTANATTAPDGTSTAENIITTDEALSVHRIRRTNAIPLAVNTATWSVFVKANGYTKVALREGVTSGSTAAFDLSGSGSLIADNQVGAVAVSNSTITSLSNGWFRISTTFTGTTSVGFDFVILNPSYTSGIVTTGWTADGVSGVFLWGAQLEQRSSVTAYTATTTAPITNYIPALQTAASGVARFEHNPVTGESLGLEIEEQRTNLAVRSEEFDNASWTKSNATISANTAVAPDGTLTADKLVDNSTVGEHRVLLSGSALAASTSHTATVYAKASGRNQIQLRVRDVSDFAKAVFNLSTGTVDVVNNGTATITNVGNGWYRCSVTGTTPASTSGLSYFIQPAVFPSADPPVYSGNGFDGVLLWGAMVEAGSFATSYIPTVASQVTRSADSATMTGSNFSSWFRADEGTLYSEASSPSTFVPITINSNVGGDTNQLGTRNRASGVSGSIAGATVNSVNVVGDFTSATFSSGNKVSLAYKIDDFAASLNGATAMTDTSGAVPVVNQAILGSLTSTSFTGTIKKIAYYPKRLTNAELQGLTTV
jgi:hypothetical protein